MKHGLIARGNNRGLGIICQEWARHMRPDKTLIVQPDSAHDAGLQLHSEWFAPDAMHTRWFDTLDEQQCRVFLEGLDLLVTFETPYDYRLYSWASDMGVRSVCWLMPEYYRAATHPELPQADQYFAPTTWRLDHLPSGTEVIPIPVALDRFPQRADDDEGPPRWLHVIGARAAADRNGTKIMLEALRYLRGEHRVIIRSQGDQLYPNGRIGRHVHLETHTTEAEAYWEGYSAADALVLPRRYGGLSLPAQEAMGAGLALVMPDVEPQSSTWPIVPIAASFDNFITTSAGSIPICAPDPKDLAKTMDWLGQHRGALRVEQQRSRAWAEANSWERLEPVVRDALERATEPR